jgi:rubrerythrin
MKAILTSMEVLAIAIRSQADAARLFGHLSRLSADPESRAKFRRLAREEARHKQVLVQLYRKMAPEDATPPPITSLGSAVPRRMGVGMQALLRQALDQANQAHEFYHLAARSAVDLSSKLVFESLFQAALQQAALLREELEAGLPIEKGRFVFDARQRIAMQVTAL